MSVFRLQSTKPLLILALLPALLPAAGSGASDIGRRGGRLVVAQRSEPRSLHPVFALDEPSRGIIGLLHAPLLRIHPGTQLPEGVLTESWKVSADGTEIVLQLRRGLAFSDGAPLTVDDVLFTFAVHQDPTIASPQQELLKVGGAPVRVERAGDRAIRLRLPQPYALGERMVAGIAILPRHKLGAPYREGKLAAAWPMSTAVADMAGAGPYKLKRVEPGRRIVLERNPHYWRKDRKGRALPYLDEIEFLSTAGEEAQTARLLAGEADLITGFGGAGFRTLEASGAAAGVRPYDAGPSLDYTFLLFNLNPGRTQPSGRWFEQEAFRQAVSLAIDRESIARLVYRGRASAIWNPVTPARKQWFDAASPRPSPSVSKARELLQSAGFRWDEQGRALDSQGVPVQFTLVANASNPAYTQTGAILEEDLKRLGIEARLVPLEFRSLVDRVVNKRDYEAAIMALRPGDADPAADMNAFVSKGRTRLWNLSGRPDRTWEADLDRLMAEQLTIRDTRRRRAVFLQVQAILSRQLPMVCLVSPNLLWAVRGTLGNVQPGVTGDMILWNADELYWEADARRR